MGSNSRSSHFTNNPDHHNAGVMQHGFSTWQLVTLFDLTITELFA
jgi:hypothetical protein